MLTVPVFSCLGRAGFSDHKKPISEDGGGRELAGLGADSTCYISGSPTGGGVSIPGGLDKTQIPAQAPQEFLLQKAWRAACKCACLTSSHAWAPNEVQMPLPGVQGTLSPPQTHLQCSLPRTPALIHVLFLQTALAFLASTALLSLSPAG